MLFGLGMLFAVAVAHPAAAVSKHVLDFEVDGRVVVYIFMYDIARFQQFLLVRVEVVVEVGVPFGEKLTVLREREFGFEILLRLLFVFVLTFPVFVPLPVRQLSMGTTGTQ